MRPSLAAAVVALASLICACGSQSQPAASVVFIPGTTFARTTTSVADGRVMVAFLDRDATRAQREALRLRIAALPQVEKYAFAGTADMRCLLSRLVRYDSQPRWSDEGDALSAAYWIVLRDPDEMSDVVAALRREPALRRDDSSYSGVQPARDVYAEIERELADGSE